MCNTRPRSFSTDSNGNLRSAAFPSPCELLKLRDTASSQTRGNVIASRVTEIFNNPSAPVMRENIDFPTLLVTLVLFASPFNLIGKSMKII